VSSDSGPGHPAVRQRADGVAALVGLGIAVACGFVVREGTVGTVELALFHAINGLPDVLTPPARVVQLLGIIAVGPIAAVIAALFRRWRLATACLLVTAGKLFTERVVWQVVQRSRPGTTISDAIVRGDTPSHGVSFVSGHVILLTGLAWVAMPYLHGRWRLMPWAIVAIVSFARVYLGAHAPLDVVGGIALGLVVGGIVNLLVEAHDRSREVGAVVDLA
jgi:membrane-associated phospholipid phosphatase